LAFLHNHKQIHRDIKPGNILLNSLGEVKIADFGITKVVDGAGANARSFVGTMCYMVRESLCPFLTTCLCAHSMSSSISFCLPVLV
jgi:serine/threonine protein kinase